MPFREVGCIKKETQILLAFFLVLNNNNIALDFKIINVIIKLKIFSDKKNIDFFL